MTASAVASELPVSVRPARPDELGFVVETSCKVRWPRSGVTWQEWREIHEPVVRSWLQGPGHVLVIESGGVVLGFIVTAGTVVCMLYVKRDFRGARYGRRLLDSANTLHGDGQPYTVYRPNACWRIWCEKQRIAWTDGSERAR